MSTPKEVLQKLNQSLLKKSKSLGGDLSDTHSLPASMGLVIELNFFENRISLAHVGDTFAILYFRNKSSKVITDDRNQAFDSKMFDLMRKIAKEKDITNKEARKDKRVNKALVDMLIERNNNPNGSGSGIINGDPNMEGYIFTSSFDLKDKVALLVASDGLEIQGHSLEDPSYRLRLAKIIEEGGMKKMVEIKRKSENDDSDWNNIRYKHSDDATGVYIKLKPGV